MAQGAVRTPYAFTDRQACLRDEAYNRLGQADYQVLDTGHGRDQDKQRDQHAPRRCLDIPSWVIASLHSHDIPSVARPSSGRLAIPSCSG
ncbi:hypothetical protein GCM10023350_14460 [Nocardioides endophyticus]|uniref:Uncharacterized protein n=1 Tax=Nocardioides endophyticus TaxID=1353775 RepID=A0ABP8YN83_9ACTN